ncbi:MAG TPA: 3-hydroxyacyl-CoA dehydrogenase family protein [Gemmatimonadota bacterium]|nr:3-hydroxyacyl-CoA dehydrogenase family protein [Gemmatimonadota bacterium]
MEHEDDVRLEPPGPVAVLGAGTMGHGIAHVAALAGYETRLYDVEAGALETARAQVEADLAKGVELGKVEAADRDRALETLTTTTGLEEALDGARVVVEAVPERLSLKQDVLTRAAEGAAPNALLASNTSSLSITALAEPVPGPERVVGLHFFNPVHIMALVEVVRGDRSAPHAVERARDFAERLGKKPIVVQDSPGFASSRLGVALGLEAIRMLEEGVAGPEDIDRAMELGYRHPMGPLRLTDLVGLDVRLEIARYLHSELGERFRPPELLERMVEEGKLGRKSGQGFYSW